MNKCIFRKFLAAVLFSLISLSAFAQNITPLQTIKNYAAKLSQYQAEKNYIYFLCTYYKMKEYYYCLDEDEISETDLEAIKIIVEKYEEMSDDLVDLLEEGNPGFETTDRFERYAGWKKNLIQFEQYFSENSPICIYASKLKKAGYDYENRKVNYSTKLEFEFEEIFEELMELLQDGYEEAFYDDDIFEGWPMVSVQKTVTSNYFYNKTALAHIEQFENIYFPDNVHLNSFMMGFDLDSYSCDLSGIDDEPDLTLFSVVLAITDENGNVLIKGTEQLLGQEKDYIFSGVTSELSSKIYMSEVKLEILSFNLNYGNIKLKNVTGEDLHKVCPKIPLKITGDTFFSYYDE